MSDLANAVLPLIRPRAELWRCSAANAHGRQMHAAVDLLEAAQDTPPTERLSVCQKAIASAISVVLKAEIPAASSAMPSAVGHVRSALDWNARRLAVLDRDVDAIIASHARDRAVPRWLHDTAGALAEIDRPDLAIDWPKQATDHGNGHQSLQAAEHWCTLLAKHRPHEVLAARWEVFDRWPSSSTASRVFEAAGADRQPYRDQVLDRLASQPRDAVLFALLTLKEPELAWDLAHKLNLKDSDAWDRVLKEYEKLDPIATLAVHTRLVEELLLNAGAQNYQRAAKRLRAMRVLAAATSHGLDVDALITQLRETHRRRPRLLRELDRAHLP